MNTIKLIGLAAMLACAGCKVPKGDIVSVTQTFVGFKVGQNIQTQTPEVIIGMSRTTFQIVPTSTNAIHAPQVTSSLSLDQKVSSSAIDEDFTTGGAVIPTNSVARSGALSRPKTGR